MANHQLVVDGDLLEGLLIHEDTSGLILIEVLVGTTLNNHIFQFLTDIVTTLQNTTVADVLQLDVHDGVTLTRLAVLKINTYPNATVHADSCSFLNVL